VIRMKLMDPSRRTRVYLLWRGQPAEDVVYIGSTRGLVWKRVKAHERKGWDFEEFTITDGGPYSHEQGKAVEKALIEDFNPIYKQRVQ
jgi:hypothetical protein